MVESMTEKYKRFKEMGFDVEWIKGGQMRRYSDTENEYVITSSKSEEEVQKFCTTILDHYSENMDWFDGTYTFRKIDDNKYSYIRTYPYID